MSVLCTRCNQPIVAGKFGTYTNAEDGTKHDYCYPCCAEMDKTQMRETGRIGLYLTKPDGQSYKVTNWPATLEFVPLHVSKGRHNIAGSQYRFRFEFEGEMWCGCVYGESTQLAHCRRMHSRLSGR